MTEVPTAQVRRNLAEVLGCAVASGSTLVTRGGVPFAVIASPETAASSAAPAERLRDRRSPFSRGALDKWTEHTLSRADQATLLKA